MPDRIGEMWRLRFGGILRAISISTLTSAVIVAVAAHGWYHGPVNVTIATRLPAGKSPIE